MLRFDRMTACTFCSCDVTGHDPVYVEEVEDGERVPAGRFRSYACLVRHVESEELQTGTACHLGAN